MERTSTCTVVYYATNVQLTVHVFKHLLFGGNIFPENINQPNPNFIVQHWIDFVVYNYILHPQLHVCSKCFNSLLTFVCLYLSAQTIWMPITWKVPPSSDLTLQWESFNTIPDLVDDSLLYVHCSIIILQSVCSIILDQVDWGLDHAFWQIKNIEGAVKFFLAIAYCSSIAQYLIISYKLYRVLCYMNVLHWYTTT